MVIMVQVNGVSLVVVDFLANPGIVQEMSQL